MRAVPHELQPLPQWVLWRGQPSTRAGVERLNKIPIDPRTLRKASSIDPHTWNTYAYCVEALPVALEDWQAEDPETYRGGGLGFVFTPEDPYCGIDLDHVIDTTGTMQAWAAHLLGVFRTYTEVSPSGTGVHLLGRGTLGQGHKRGAVECYDRGRFFTMTGQHVPGTSTTLADIQQPLAWLVQCDEVLAKALDRHGDRFSPLCAGQWHGTYPSQSEADLAFCRLAVRCGATAEQCDALVRLSGLYRAKWDERHGSQTYGEMTIAKALTGKEGRSACVDGDGAEDPTESFRPLPYSDYTNALALVRLHGQDLRYCHPWGKWLRWHGTHWQEDQTGALMRDAKTTITQLIRRALDRDGALSADLAKHVKASLSTGKLKAMLESAQSEAGIYVLPAALDQDVWQLNCTNGTLDLRTGHLRAHQRDDLLTRMIPVAYHAQAACPTWEAFLWRLMGGSGAWSSPDASVAQLEAADERARILCTFVQRALGYCLTGDVSEQVLFVLYGVGKNGKSTLVNTLLALLGPYAMKATSELLMVTRSDRHPTERADLFRKRLVATIETSAGGRLNEVFVKEATGGDPIRARRMREDFWQFDPTHKIILATNHKPEIRGTDYAIWRRIRLVPFTVVIPPGERDGRLPEKLRQEFPGILAWLMQGCLQWQQEGLGEPEEVSEATEGYRAAMDVLGQFLAECCLLGVHYRTKAAELYAAYREWCDRTGEYAEGQRLWGMRLTERGFERRRTGLAHWWIGIGLLDPTTTASDPSDRR